VQHTVGEAYDWTDTWRAQSASVAKHNMQAAAGVKL